MVPEGSSNSGSVPEKQERKKKKLEEGGEMILTRACGGRTMGNDFKVKEIKFRLDVKKKS